MMVNPLHELHHFEVISTMIMPFPEPLIPQFDKSSIFVKTPTLLQPFHLKKKYHVSKYMNNYSY